MTHFNDWQREQLRGVETVTADIASKRKGKLP